MALTLIKQHKVFDGWYQQYTHDASTLNCSMRFSLFLPPLASRIQPAPVVYWLSGLTCSDENFSQKAGAFRSAARLGLALVICDTSPRGESVSDDNAYDLGQGAGFYLNATQTPWASHYQMYDYVSLELPALIEANFPVSQKRSICGHSMGGHGALVMGLRNPARYCAISAFSPITQPSQCPWGRKAFKAYLGNDISAWHAFDATALLSQGQSPLPILIDQGEDDEFLNEQLNPQALIDAAKLHQSPLKLRMQAGYDHSYYFIASFIDEHLNFHAQQLHT